jgi:hypothetical protein
MPEKGTLVDSLMTILFVIYYIPLNAAFSLNNTDYSFFWKSNLYFFLILLFVNWFIKAPKNAPNLLNNDKDPICKAFDPTFVQLMCIFVCLFCIAYKISYNGFSFSLSFESDDVYSTRGEFQNSLDEMSGSLFSYIFSIVRNLADMIIPLYLYYAITQKKPMGLLMSLLALLSMFAVKSSKASMLFVLVVLAMAVLRKTKFVKTFCMWFSAGILGLMLVCLLEKALLDSSRIYMLLVRRMLYYPAWLNSLYFEFFDQNAKVMWSQDTFLLQMIQPSRYPEGILATISNYFYKGEIPSPNTGLFAEAYMHWGNLGIVLYPMLLTCIIKFSQKVFTKFGDALAILVAAKLVLKLTNVPMVRTDFMLSFTLFTVAMSFLPIVVVRHKRVRKPTPQPRVLSAGTKTT